MAVLSTILVVLGAWCAASVVTAALYTVLRRLHVRQQRASAALPDVPRAAPVAQPGARTGLPGRAGPPVGLHRSQRLHRLHLHRPHRLRRPAHPSGRSGWSRRVPPPDLQAG
ncbi:hypothetical protein ACIA8F_29000 [Streptomyces sp. NPDC051563]|uniref:hypothetical protein n=1 Tax=Streptomyces sp. NPDC051563 TaxID=3365659 RepID=UPI003793335D